MASPCLTVPLPGGRPWPSGRISISQPAISSGLAWRPMPSGFACVAAVCLGAAPPTPPAATPSASVAAVNIAIVREDRESGHLDILNLAVAAQMPGLDAVVVVDRIDAADLAQLGLARLHIAGLVNRARLQQ